MTSSLPVELRLSKICTAKVEEFALTVAGNLQMLRPVMFCAVTACDVYFHKQIYAKYNITFCQFSLITALKNVYQTETCVGYEPTRAYYLLT